MLNENAKKWVAALRSGRYRQTTGLLTRDGAYCCLGVACAIAEDAGLDLPNWHDDGALPWEVRQWLGMKSQWGNFLIDGQLLGTELTVLNDNGSTFAEIAEIIESEPEGLFE